MDVATILRRLIPARDRGRLVPLDALRGVAILLVLFTHTTVQPDEAGVLRPALAYLRYLGPSGVDLFFVLSGFLVGGLLLREVQETGRLDVRRFLIRRGFKIWPSYFAFLAFVGVWAVAVEGNSIRQGAWRLAPNVLHLQNYLGSPREH
jgi:peptidoglycan/LPS O-acetylase OafA/YrhL